MANSIRCSMEEDRIRVHSRFVKMDVLDIAPHSRKLKSVKQIRCLRIVFVAFVACATTCEGLANTRQQNPTSGGSQLLASSRQKGLLNDFYESPSRQSRSRLHVISVSSSVEREKFPRHNTNTVGWDRFDPTIDFAEIGPLHLGYRATSLRSPGSIQHEELSQPLYFASVVEDPHCSLETDSVALSGNSSINDSLLSDGIPRVIDVPHPSSSTLLGTAPLPEASPQPKRRWRRFLQRRKKREHVESGSSPDETPRKIRARQLSSLLAKTAKRGSKSLAKRQYVARTITGLINALADEVEDLDVEVKTQSNGPLHVKHIQSVNIQFSRLGFKPLRLGGHAATTSTVEDVTSSTTSVGGLDGFWRARIAGNQTNTIMPLSADEAFDKMDVDNSGTIDREEMVQALTMVAGTSAATAEASSGKSNTKSPILERLAAELFRIYDKNGDGVVDRGEYKSMVYDMALLRRKQVLRELRDVPTESSRPNWFGSVLSFVQNGGNNSSSVVDERQLEIGSDAFLEDSSIESTALGGMKHADFDAFGPEDGTSVVVSSSDVVDAVKKTVGSINFSDVKMDLRRLLFGAVPVVKRVVPGGPLILEPFTMTLTGSFNREDILNSALLDAGLRRLVMRALRKRVGFLRDFTEGSMFRGRSWKTFGGEGPVVEIPRLSNVEFQNDKLIITGSTRIKTTPLSSVFEQKFKLRTSIGSRRNGRFVRLEQPELALVIECPESWEKATMAFCDAFELETPARPEPLYSFFPIYSPFKLQEDDDGFDLGSDNAITSLYIKDGALRFEMSAVLRPGKFLGSHYIAFTTPIRTLIVTLDRVTEGMRAARQAKKAKRADTGRRFFSLNRAEDALLARQDLRAKQPVKPSKVKSFFSRFVDGYLQAEREDTVEKERMTQAVRDFFGRQGKNEE